MSCIEITAASFCPVNCSYCPQKYFISEYSKLSPEIRFLTFDKFIYALKKIPQNITINFTGFSEIFTNPHAIDMIEYAHRSGYRVLVSSTLVGLSVLDAKRLVQIPIPQLCLHLPDNLGNANIPDTGQYREVLGIVLRGVDNILYARMNSTFKNNTRCGSVGEVIKHENIVGYCCIQHKFSDDNLDMVMLPDLSVIACCMDYKLKSYIGNLYDNTYGDLIKNIKRYKPIIERSICRFCPFFVPPQKYYLIEYYLKLKGLIRNRLDLFPDSFQHNVGDTK